MISQLMIAPRDHDQSLSHLHIRLYWIHHSYIMAEV